MTPNQFYSVCIIGAGHAGVEAAVASSKIAKLNGDRVALITLRDDNIGQMSCNPAIGGIGKGVITREIDALGGLMGRAIDKSSIHSKILNKSKGEAVWGPRAQADRELYAKSTKEILLEYDNLDIVIDSCEDLLIENDKIVGIFLKKHGKIETKSVVLTTGTFLNGLILIGNKRIKSGRINEEASYGISNSLARYNFALGRLKTGTPARLYKDSINWGILEKQEGDNPPVPFSYLTDKINVPQIDCYITNTNAISHKIMLDNADQSPIYTKEVTAKGPRYCPSIEDKIIRFSQRESHRIFLEPEGLNSQLVYPNGISTAMSEDVQDKFLNAIKGLENVKIAQYGYAIEYDYVNPQELKPTLETKKIVGLFFAGQINGTTGYEEAGGQGIVAGINASLRAANVLKEFIIDRSEAYIGVMIDDLTTKGIIEPYRIFTSRSEYRLSIRADNADMRMTQKAIDLGFDCLLERERIENFTKKCQDIARYRALLESRTFTPNDLEKIGIIISNDGIRRNGFELLTHQMISFDDVAEMFEFGDKNCTANDLDTLDPEDSLYNYDAAGLLSAGGRAEPKTFHSESFYATDEQCSPSSHGSCASGLRPPHQSSRNPQQSGVVAGILENAESACGSDIKNAGNLSAMPENVKRYIEVEAKYHFYLKRQKEDIEMFKKDENIKIPSWISYSEIKALSSEIIEKLNHAQPTTIGQASRIQGVTPAAIMAIMIAIKSDKKTKQN